MLVIPAKAGLRRQDAEANIRAANGPQGTRQEPRVIQFLLLARHSCVGRNPVLSFVLLFVFLRARASTPPAEERVTSLACPREVTKRRAPRTSRSTGILPFDCARRLRGLLDVHPYTCRKLACLLHAILRTFLRPRAATHGAPVRAARSCAQKQRQQPASCGALACFALLLCLALLLCFVFASARRSALLPGPRRARRAHGGSGPAGGACTMHALFRTHMDVRPENPGMRSRTCRAGCPEGATDRGRLLFGYFLLARQEKVTRSSAGGVEALALEHTRQSERKNWITRGSCRVPCGPFAARMFASASCLRSPACAGLTSGEQELGSSLRWNDEERR